MTSLVDLLGPLEQERIFMLFTSDRVKVRSLTTSFYHFRIPLSTGSGTTSYKALQIKPLLYNPDKILVGLLWNAVFGKKFKIVHWFILFQVLSRTIQFDVKSRTILAILMIITAKAGQSWNTNLTPVMTIIRKVAPSDFDKEIDELLKGLPVRLPEKGPKIEEIFRISEVTVQMHRPKELVRIGKGYKDKGSLNSGPGYDPLPPDLFFEAEDVFDRLVRQTRKKYWRFIQ